MNLKHLALLCAALIFSQQTSAADKDNDDRWFEVEVILFSQLGDKAQLKEKFPNNTLLPQYRNIIDLLGPYLNPDIASLKQQLPRCDNPTYAQSLLEQAITAIKEQPYYVAKSLAELQTLSAQTIDESLTDPSISKFSDGTHRQVALDNIDDSPASINNSLKAYDNSSLAMPLPKQVMSEKELTQRLMLLEQAAAEFSTLPLTYTNETASFTDGICTISVEEFQHFNQSTDAYAYQSYNAFNIEQVPPTINNIENIYSDEDYLLNKESLQLDDIVKEIARSRNFKPLLHFGWRQKTKTKQLAVPLKVIAGENFAEQYQKELQQFQQQRKQAQRQEEALHSVLYKDTSAQIEGSDETVKEKIMAERLQELLIKLPNLPTETKSLLAEIEQDINDTAVILNTNTMQAAPIKPPQNWTVEGFIKVEVDFYLHITADLNVMNMSLAEQATQKLLPGDKQKSSAILKTINFKQDRRVRSTEIHYFDHPYIGMIIRILPYDKPTKEVEQSTPLN
ncbi:MULTISPECIES: CsiV family protein [unclassified Colwellia]|uniref:CsiV family protein n=1 Tax=unclassified Colwellia TaxID=196834 RepID=UPI0015F38F43|nr:MULTISPECIES: CsiV family protein [unclassified Colwellia]MBA6347105.1 hypothetical protein [Colwellia sp. BRX8-9]MBA6351017.1 hypothetical protein [Colwellia sp. BRX9-1]MBA6356088.1 hypothetical protein [Colwellia sp. BRX8-3]MBA6358655.1 hypothetical protein [Colwellia sp. BRX8-6]MBA6366694.1 hypothetical protein [Colwellia sp. BRX8-5]